MVLDFTSTLLKVAPGSRGRAPLSGADLHGGTPQVEVASPRGWAASTCLVAGEAEAPRFGLDLVLIRFSLNGHPWPISRASGRRCVRSPEPGRSAPSIHSRVSPAPFIAEPRKDEVSRPGVPPQCPPAPRQTGSAIGDRHVKSDGSRSALCSARRFFHEEWRACHRRWATV